MTNNNMVVSNFLLKGLRCIFSRPHIVLENFNTKYGIEMVK